MKKYIKKPIAIVAKIFEKGDEDGYNQDDIPFINTLEGRALQANFGEHYIVFGNHNDKWLVKKEVFEDTYQEVIDSYRTEN